MNKVSEYEYLNLEKLALNPHHKMSDKQLKALEEGRQLYAEPLKHDIKFVKRTEEVK